MAGYEYRRIDPSRDQIISDQETSKPIGIRTDQDMSMINGVTDISSGLFGSMTAISDRQFTIPTNMQAVSIGGITVSGSASFTCGGELVCLAY